MATHARRFAREVFFGADTPYGPLCLSVPRRTFGYRRLDSIDRVIGLEAIERHVRRLEDWLGCPIEPEARSGRPREHRSLVSVAERGRSGSAVTVHLEPDAWYGLPAPPTAEDDASWTFGWADVRTELALSEPRLDDDDLARLDVGTVTLLPETFEEEWLTRLYPDGARTALRGTLDLDTDRWSGAPEEVGDGDGPGARALDVGTPARVGTMLSVPAHALLDCGSGLTLPVDAALRDCRCTLSVRGRRRFAGNLLPVADGFAFVAAEALARPSPHRERD